jgi:perosamine synthetase
MIHLHEPLLDRNDLKNLLDCYNSGWISTGGDKVKAFEKLICKITGAKYAIATNNCTAALQISLMMSGVKPGDEVIVPAISFIATINSVIYNFGSPVFMDVDDYFNLDVDKTIKFLSENTFTKKGHTYNKKTKKIIRAVVVVHIFGNPANVNKLKNICKKLNIKIVEDAAESLGSYYFINKKKIHTGTESDFGCISFNGNKVITSGGGGVILVKSNQLEKKIRYIINQSKDDTIYFRHHNLGFNMSMTNLHGAIGLSQLQKLEKIIKIKKRINLYYSNNINKIQGLKILPIPKKTLTNSWLNILEVNSKIYGKNKTKLIQKFLMNKINVRSIWYPNHKQKFLKKYQSYNITNAIKKYETSICLPSGPGLTKVDLKKVLDILK